MSLVESDPLEVKLVVVLVDRTEQRTTKATLISEVALHLGVVFRVSFLDPLLDQIVEPLVVVGFILRLERLIDIDKQPLPVAADPVHVTAKVTLEVRDLELLTSLRVETVDGDAHASQHVLEEELLTMTALEQAQHPRRELREPYLTEAIPDLTHTVLTDGRETEILALLPVVIRDMDLDVLLAHVHRPLVDGTS